VAQSFRKRDPEAAPYVRAFLTELDGRVLGAFRIGRLANPSPPSLRRELEWIAALAVPQLLNEAGPPLEDRAIAVLPTKTPREFDYFKLQRAMERRIRQERERLEGLGMNASDSASSFPVYILGVRYPSLRAAEDRAAELAYRRQIDDTGEMSAVVSRVLIDELERRSEDASIQVVPAAELIDEFLAFDREELAQVEEGILAPERREDFERVGAQVLLFNEIRETEQSFELALRLRRTSDLAPLTRELRYELDPRFALALEELTRNSE
jgi:hypothetical protein